MQMDYITTGRSEAAKMNYLNLLSYFVNVLKSIVTSSRASRNFFVWLGSGFGDSPAITVNTVGGGKKCRLKNVDYFWKTTLPTHHAHHNDQKLANCTENERDFQ